MEFWMTFPSYWEWHNHPNWRSPSFFRGVGQPPTRYSMVVFFWNMFSCVFQAPNRSVVKVGNRIVTAICGLRWNRHGAWPQKGDIVIFDESCWLGNCVRWYVWQWITTYFNAQLQWCMMKIVMIYVFFCRRSHDSNESWCGVLCIHIYIHKDSKSLPHIY